MWPAPAREGVNSLMGNGGSWGNRNMGNGEWEIEWVIVLFARLSSQRRDNEVITLELTSRSLSRTSTMSCATSP